MLWACAVAVESEHVHGYGCGSGHVKVWRHARACMWVCVQWTCECVEAHTCLHVDVCAVDM